MAKKATKSAAVKTEVQQPNSEQTTDRHVHSAESGHAFWAKLFVPVVYADVEPGDAVEVTNSSGEVSTVVVQYVISKGVSGDKSKYPGKPFTKFLPVPEVREKKEAKTHIPVKQTVDALRNEMPAMIAAAVAQAMAEIGIAGGLKRK